MPGDPFYRSADWLRARGRYLAGHRVCETPRCGQPSSHVDHKVARARGGAPLDPANFKALCPSCHSRKTVRHDGGFGRPQTRQRAVGVDGWPMAPTETLEPPQGGPGGPSGASPRG